MRCFTVLLACGWLLFTPPYNQKAGYFDATRPLAEWDYRQAFDKAEECQTHIAQENFMNRNLDPNSSVTANLKVIWLNAKCVPTDALGFKFK